MSGRAEGSSRPPVPRFAAVCLALAFLGGAAFPGFSLAEIVPEPGGACPEASGPELEESGPGTGSLAESDIPFDPFVPELAGEHRLPPASGKEPLAGSRRNSFRPPSADRSSRPDSG
jgi:hypothetical protein